MNFSKGQHKFYLGIDLHARKMYLYILDEKGEVKLHRNMDRGQRSLSQSACISVLPLLLIRFDEPSKSLILFPFVQV